LLAVIDQVVVKVGRQNDGSSRYRTRKASTTGLITTSLDASSY
jgi:hypothetical protein